MAKKIIILNKTPQTNYFEVDYIFWLTIPSAQKALRINASAVSAFPSATADELVALRDGSILEVGGKTSYSTGTTTAAIGTDLIAKFNAAQTDLNADVKFSYFGTFWDGTSWTIQGA